MRESALKKAVRTAQNGFPGLRETKNEIYHWARSSLGLLHDRDFRMIGRLPQRADELFLDVGGNRGQSILSLRRMRPDAPVVSFEPNGAMFRWLERHFGDAPNVRLINVGLGAETATRILYTPRYGRFAYDGLATFSRDVAYSYLSPETLYGFDRARLSVEEEVCRTQTLDSFNLSPTFIKIDVEGLEHEVLQGGAETIAEHEPVLLVERYHPNPALVPLLERLGYVEVRPSGRSFERGTTRSENMLCMTPRVLAEIQTLHPTPESPRRRLQPARVR